MAGIKVGRAKLNLQILENGGRMNHNELIQNQFTRQAEVFSNAKVIADERALASLWRVVAAWWAAPLRLRCGK
jgi:hypothetical protein